MTPPASCGAASTVMLLSPGPPRDALRLVRLLRSRVSEGQVATAASLRSDSASARLAGDDSLEPGPCSGASCVASYTLVVFAACPTRSDTAAQRQVQGSMCQWHTQTHAHSRATQGGLASMQHTIPFRRFWCTSSGRAHTMARILHGMHFFPGRSWRYASGGHTVPGPFSCRQALAISPDSV